MVTTVPAQQGSSNGPRPINLNKDIPQVVQLLETVFGERLNREGRQALNSAMLTDTPAFLWRLNPTLGRLAPGFVWVENGRIIGNITLLQTKIPDRYLVVNVAVHPDFRRQGIARILMQEVMDTVEARRGRVIVLQVVRENSAAIALYKSLQFKEIGSMTSWYSSTSRLQTIASGEDGRLPRIRELRGHEWRAAYRLDQLSLHPDLNWPTPPPADHYKGGWGQRLRNFLNGRQSETWLMTNNRRQLTGMAAIFSEWGQPHIIKIRIHPNWREQLERPLFAKAIRRLQYLSYRNIRLDHPDDDVVMNDLLTEANFGARRTLTHMRLDL